jgi:hypothetical protein
MALIAKAGRVRSGLSALGFSTRAPIVLGTCACAAVSFFFFEVDPNQHAIYPTCLFHKATGLYCAGCGATRALYAMLHGRILDALHDNALFMAALPLLFGWASSYLIQAWREQHWPRPKTSWREMIEKGAWAFLLMLLFMLVRNLPGWPFDLLKPLTG